MKTPIVQWIIGLALLVASVAGCASTSPGGGSRVEEGLAAYYADEYHGRRTASGERYDREAMTAAHRTLPFGTRVQVTNLENGRRVRVRINDRGPFTNGRIIDLSRAAARKLDMIRAGTVRVRVEVE